jgi:hypothetical protein
MSELKFCKDCRYYTPSTGGPIGRECAHPKNAPLSLVTGQSGPRLFFASTLRKSEVAGDCGEAALWFEAKPPEPWPFPEPAKDPVGWLSLFVQAPERPRWKLWLARTLGL